MYDPTLFWWSVGFLLVAGLVVLRHWRTDRGLGLVPMYVFSFAAIYWICPTIYLLPWYDSRSHDLTVQGLRISTIGLLAFLVGAELGLRILSRKARVVEAPDSRAPQRVGSICLITGIVLYAVVTPASHSIPSLTAITSSGSALVVSGLVLRCWTAWHTKRLWRWLLATTLLPLATVVGQGFLGYGFASLATVFAFVASIYRPRWKVMVMAVVVGYAGLSVFVTYMRDREDIRQTVWGGAAYGDRLAQLTETVDQFEWFDLGNPDHLDRLDERLNQDYFVGLSAERLRTNRNDFAHGGTLVDAVLAMVPRALWPDKPVGAGSGDLVSIYTGLYFMEGTSVGIGQVMEFYVNFGLLGVCGGLGVVGLLLSLVDGIAGTALRRGELRRFLIWYTPGLSLLMVGGSLVEVTSSAAGAIVLTSLVSYWSARQRPRPAVAPALSRPHVPS
jgi:hypothetical protein